MDFSTSILHEPHVWYSTILGCTCIERRRMRGTDTSQYRSGRIVMKSPREENFITGTLLAGNAGGSYLFPRKTYATLIIITTHTATENNRPSPTTGRNIKDSPIAGAEIG